MYSPGGEVRTVRFVMPPTKKTELVEFSPTKIPALKIALSDILEWRLTQATLTWEPLVSGVSPAVVGIVATTSNPIFTSMKSDNSLGFNMGMVTRVASARRSTQTSAPGGANIMFTATTVSHGGYMAYVNNGTSSADAGRVTGVLTIRVCGSSTLPA